MKLDDVTSCVTVSVGVAKISSVGIVCHTLACLVCIMNGTCLIFEW